jgi:hypothetical protein
MYLILMDTSIKFLLRVWDPGSPNRYAIQGLATCPAAIFA